MVWFKRLGSWAETVNTYYEFALLALAAALFAMRHTRVVELVVAIALPFLAGWSGYLIRAMLDQRDNRGGFRLVSNIMSYEIGKNNTYVLRYVTKLRATSDHLMVYPIGYQWTGSGEEGVPKVTGPGQQLLGPVRRNARGTATKAVPYESTAVSADDHWHYWFVVFNPPLDANDVVDVRYTQEFRDKRRTAKPYLYYVVRVPMERLELRVKFPTRAVQVNITASFIKPSNPLKAYVAKGMHYDAESRTASWIIEKPKKGYSYRLHWHV